MKALASRLLPLLLLVGCEPIGCQQKTPLQAKQESQKLPRTLFCGIKEPGCEDVATNTVEIRFLSDKIEVIRKYHGSDIPVTSAFVAEGRQGNEIKARFDRKLTEANWDRVQQELPAGDVVLQLDCKDYDALSDCKVSGKAISPTVKVYPGWDYAPPTNLECNTKEFRILDAPDCAEQEESGLE